MKFGVALFPLRPAQMVDVVTAAEELGFDAAFLGEHVISPLHMTSEYPYAQSTPDAPAYHPGLPFYDPYGALSFLAARTTAIKFCLSLSIVPLHDPYHLARSIATIDLFSGQRFLFGIGAGWLKEEFDIVGKGWSDRGARLDETLDLLEVLWNEDEPAFDGAFYSLPPSMFEPKPLSRPHPPYIFGGITKAAIRRTALRGDGWFGVGVDVESTARLVDDIRSLRDPAKPAVEITVAVPPDVQLDEHLVEKFEKAGVDRLQVRPWVRGRDALTSIETLARRLGIAEP
jgi:probable F420-dependent oxidoreductase